MLTVRYFLFFFFTAFWVTAQYTETINSNRPGTSHGAFAIGWNVLQVETGVSSYSMEHKNLNNSKVDGLNQIPFLSNLLMEKWYPVKKVWDKLPWNREYPSCEISVIYIDDELRIMKDLYGSVFIYIRPTNSLLKK